MDASPRNTDEKAGAGYARRRDYLALAEQVFMEMKLKTLPPPIRAFDFRAIKPAPKIADAIYRTAEHREWRAQVIARAGGRCQAIDDGQRCRKAAPHHRMFADHIREVGDGGALFDVANGQCLCGSHHTSKTTATRAKRLRGEL
jgi:5-methylcytosine-specific restriction protein A